MNKISPRARADPAYRISLIDAETHLSKSYEANK